MSAARPDETPVARYGAIDIGTNSVLLTIAERRGADLVPVEEHATITRLGQGVDATRRLAPDAVERTLACLEGYAERLAAWRVDRRAAVATSAARDAAGGEAFRARAGELLGVEPRVISGLEEARLTFVGAVSGLPLRGPLRAFDVGGGSTEVVAGVVGDDGATPDPESLRSLDVGSVRLFERHGGEVSASSRAAAAEFVRRMFDTLPISKPLPLVGVAGTVTTLAAIDLEMDSYDSARVHGRTLLASRVRELSDRLWSLDLAARRDLPGLDPRRADVIPFGATLVEQVMAWAGADALVVSDRGVRWGLLAELAR